MGLFIEKRLSRAWQFAQENRVSLSESLGQFFRRTGMRAQWRYVVISLGRRLLKHHGVWPTVQSSPPWRRIDAASSFASLRRVPASFPRAGRWGLRSARSLRPFLRAV